MHAFDSLFSKNHGHRKTRFEVLPEINVFCNQQLPYHKTQYEDILFRYQGGFNTHTGLPDHQNVFDKPISWQNNAVFKSEPPFTVVDVGSKRIKSTNDGYVKQNIDQNSSFRFGTLEIPAHFNSQVDYSVNHIYENMTTSEINTLPQLCESERCQILTLLSLAQTNPFMARYLLGENRSNFVLIESASLWLHECQKYLSPLYSQKETCFDRIPHYYQDTIYHVDAISHQTYSFATEITSISNTATIIALDLDGNQFYLSTPTPVKQDPPAHFKLSEIRSTIQPNTFSAHTAGLHSLKHLKGFWNRFLLRKLSDETIQILGKTIGYDFFHDSNPSLEDNKESLQFYWTKQNILGTTDRFLTLKAFFFNETGSKQC